VKRSSTAAAGLLAAIVLATLVRGRDSRDDGAPAVEAPPPRAERVPATVVSLAEARRDFRTTISHRPAGSPPLPDPPPELFVRSDYVGASGGTLPAFVTPAPGDGRRRPAIIWLTGGETNSLDDFWTPGPEADDQSASAFRAAGLVMMFPTLRGGNGGADGQEYFYGEVDDVLAAAEHLARLPYVDPERIYLGGHSTGGTLALLTAERSPRFAGVFAFGPVASVDRYPGSLVPVDLGPGDGQEVRLRSPIHWLHGVESPTWIIEGRDEPGNAADVERLCAATTNPRVQCILAAGSNHFGVLGRVTRVVAARLSVAGEIPFRLDAGEFGTPDRPSTRP
jgi:acetyl esterase/lipase